MINSVSKYSFGTGAYALANTPPEQEQQYYAPQMRQPQQDSFVSKPKDGRSFWERHLAAILGVTSIAFLAISLLNNAAKGRMKKEQLENIKKNGEEAAKALDAKFTHESVFMNYKKDDSIPTLDNLAGMKEVKKTLKVRILDNMDEDKELIEYWGSGKASGVLLYGPPGTGKTFVTKVLAKTMNAEVAEIAIKNEGSAYVNQAARNIGNKFDFICETAGKNPKQEYVVILEEIDGIGKSRGGTNENSGHLEVVNTLLTCFDKAKKHSNITIIANTNNHHLLDTALIDRLQVTIKVDNPDTETIENVIDYHLKPYKGADGFEANQVADKLKGYSNRKIQQISELAIHKGKSINKDDKAKNKLTKEVFEEAIKEFNETRTTQQLSPQEMMEMAQQQMQQQQTAPKGKFKKLINKFFG